MNKRRKLISVLSLALSLSLCAAAYAFDKPVLLADQGSFAIGGKVVNDANGGQLHGDHGYVVYQKPARAKKLPMVFLHGIYQFSKTWETTPDGRDGFQNIFLEKGYSVYNMTAPRRGNAGRATVSGNIEALRDEPLWFNRFRLGIWPNYFDGTQFPSDAPEALDQYFRQITPNTAPFDHQVTADAVVKLFDNLGAGIMVCHSQGGTHTWMAVPQTDKIKAVVAWEPGGYYTFPNDVPEPKLDFTIAEQFKNNEYITVDPQTFAAFTKIPIVIIYGDNIPTKPSGNPEQDEWGVRLQLARQWAQLVNERGGDATVIHLPEYGYRGNTHFPFSDKNNVEMAELMAKWLHEKGLDK